MLCSKLLKAAYKFNLNLTHHSLNDLIKISKDKKLARDIVQAVSLFDDVTLSCHIGPFVEFYEKHFGKEPERVAKSNGSKNSVHRPRNNIRK